MKKILTSVVVASALFTSAQAEVFTGTSVVVGFSSLGQQVRVDQYIGTTDVDMVYGKIGVAQEISDDNAVENITSVVAGVGVNAFEMNDFFVDLSAEYYFQVAGGSNAGDTFSDSSGGISTIGKDTDYNSGALAVGAGYSVGSWSFRLDYVHMLNNPDIELDTGYNLEKDFDRAMTALSVTYWW